MVTQAKAKGKTKRSDLLAKLNAIDKSIADTREKIDKKPNYGQGRSPGMFANVPNAIIGERGERHFSYTKACRLAMGVLHHSMAKEEAQIGEKLSNLYTTLGFTSGANAPTLMVPAATRFMPRDHNDASFKLVEEIRQKTAFDFKSLDPDELSPVHRKAFANYSGKALGTIVDTAGGTWVPPPIMGEFIDLQRILEIFVRAGASEVGLPPNGKAVLPKLSGGATPYVVGEGQNILESQQTTGDLLLEAKTIGVLVRLNAQFLRFSTPGSEAMVRHDMAAMAALFIDAMSYGWTNSPGHPIFGVCGTGGTQIKGLTAYPTQTSWSQGTDKLILYTASGAATNGDTFNSQDFLNMESVLPDEVEITGWVMRKNMWGILSSRRASALTANDGLGIFVAQQYVEDFTGRRSRNIEGVPVIWSSNVPNNITKGSGTTCTQVLAGKFPDWIIARSGIMELVANPYGDNTFAQNQVMLRVIQYVDAGPRHPASFALCTNLLQA